MSSQAWRYCVVGNIKKEYRDENGVLRFGTAAFSGGTKVCLCGKYWQPEMPEISIIGLGRGKEYQVHDIAVELIENVRCSQIFKPAVLKIMSNWEFEDYWWGNTPEDRAAVDSFVRKWNAKIAADNESQTVK